MKLNKQGRPIRNRKPVNYNQNQFKVDPDRENDDAIEKSNYEKTVKASLQTNYRE